MASARAFTVAAGLVGMSAQRFAISARRTTMASGRPR
jgi:hypothetical protein